MMTTVRNYLNLRTLFLLLVTFLAPSALLGEDGHRLWLRYDLVEDEVRREKYIQQLNTVEIQIAEDANGTAAAIRKELDLGLSGLTGETVRFVDQNGALLITTDLSGTLAKEAEIADKLESANDESFAICTVSVDGRETIVVAGNSDRGCLYGVFALLRHVQMQEDLADVEVFDSPKVKTRLLNHWDNLTRTTERVMSGPSLWNWFDLPYYIEPYYIDYARACASIGINGAVLTNVNANATVLHPQFIEKVAALADTFRPYGLKVYLTARFSAPIEIGGLETADPLDLEVRQWWADKIDEIYAAIPDFGGFLVKANSEGQPGPQNYGRNHADGANMMAEALEPHGGIVMWRAFVYEFETKEDRHKQAYTEFTELEGEFRSNVVIQIKNGAIDFMPREPFHPLFGATPQTAQGLELQITQEYLGGDIQLAFLAPMWKETLQADTFAKGAGSTVAKVIDGSVHDSEHSVIAGVSNVGAERNWTGHPLAQSNWYAFGRLAWDHELSSEQIADEWTRLTFSNDAQVVETLNSMLLESHQTVVDYSMPIGLHHIMAAGHHYGPGPWYDQGRPDWTSVYYHQADEDGIGFDRTETGTDALSQYFPEAQMAWEDPDSTDLDYLLWFHHLPWDYELKTENTVWEEICLRYQRGVEGVRMMQEQWDSLEGQIDDHRFRHVKALLKRQLDDAIFYKDACLAYFHTFSQRPYPDSVTPPKYDLEHYKSFELFHVPGDPGEMW